MVRFSFLISLMLLMTTASTVHAATVRAVVDRNQLVAGESVHLRIIIENGRGTVDLSGITGFKTLSRGTSSGFQSINGHTSRQVVHNYLLIPLETGALTLPAIPVTIDGTVHYTTPISIMVSDEGSADDSGRQDVYVTATVSSASLWVGQATAYTFRLFNAVQVAEARFQPPDFTGFLAEELEDRKSYRTTLNGREFIVTEIVFVLTPSTAGDLTIGPASLRVGIVSQTRRAKPFSGMDAFFGPGDVSTRMLRSDPIALQVRELPAPPLGSDFSGLVGEFEITASLDKNEVQVGDSATLSVCIQGVGNIMDAAAPVLSIPSAFKAYTDTPETVVHKSADGYSGRKIFRTALVPVTPGDYCLDQIQMTGFDVKTGTYRHMAPDPLNIRVTPSDTASEDAGSNRFPADMPPSPKKPVEFTGRDVFPLKTGPEVLVSHRPLSFIEFLALMGFPALVCVVITVVLKKVRKDETPVWIMERRSRQALKTAGDPKTPDAEFLSALYRAIVSAILGKRGMMGAGLTWAEVQNHLTQLGWTPEDAASAAKLVEEVESFNYSGGTLSLAKRQALLDAARKVVRRLMR